MKLLKPLEQFICDSCGQVIEKPEDGWLEWISERGTRKAHSFRICHHQSKSPFKGRDGCYVHGATPGNHLHHVTENRIVELLQFIDVGEKHDPAFTGPHVTSLREWAELTRRLAVPYYEQVRLSWNKAISDGYFEGANEISIYTEESLKGLIEKYAED